MSNENKTAVKEFVQRYINSHEPDTFARNENGLMMYQLKHSGINLESFFEDIIEDFISEQNELASLQTQDKDKEIAELKTSIEFMQLNVVTVSKRSRDRRKVNSLLQSTIESQQKEIEELKQGNKAKGVKIIEDAVKILQLQSQLDEVKKERDESNRIMVNRLLIMKDWLNPEPFSDIDACLNAIEHAIKSLTPTKGD